MEDTEGRLIGNEERSEDGANCVNRTQNNTNPNQTPPPGSFTLFTNEGASSQPNVDAFRPRPVASVNRPPNPGGIAPPSYQHAIQMESVPTENKESVPDEPPPQYSGPPPGYNPSQSGGDRFVGESTMSTAEEQERMNAVEDEIGRLIILSTVVQALEERDQQNGNVSAGQNAAGGPGQNSGRVPMKISSISDGPTPASAPSPGRVQVLANGRSINGARVQPVRQGTGSYDDAKRPWSNYRCLCTFFGFIVILAVGAGIGASRHSSSRNSDHSDNYHYGGHSERICQRYCHNGGTCEIRKEKSECRCPRGYDGIDCSEHTVVKPTKCVSTWCMNGGRCEETIFSVRCVCPTGTYGDRCQDATKKPPSCGDTVCENGGYCDIPFFGASPQCTCPEPYYGDRCQLMSTTTPRPN